MNIYNDLKYRTYKPGRYRTFMIFEPKPRLVMSQSIRDKMVNHFISNYYLLPYLERSLVDSNVATRKGKGSSYAMKLLKSYFNKIMINEKGKEIYALKLDISKYFYSIDYDILISMLKKKILDKDVIDLIKITLAETNKDYINENITKYNKKYNTDIPLYKNNIGLSIGAMSSQILAIFFLNNIDHYIKEKLRCMYFIRYMDDILILDTNKEKLKNIWKILDTEISKLNLKLNKKSNIYRCSNGFNFLGYKYKLNKKLIISFSKKTFLKIKRRLIYLKRSDLLKYNRSLASYYGYYKCINKGKKISFKISNINMYWIFKIKYPGYIIFLKKKNYYRTFYDYHFILQKKDFIITSFDFLINKLIFFKIPFIFILSDGTLILKSNLCF